MQKITDYRVKCTGLEQSAVVIGLLKRHNCNLLGSKAWSRTAFESENRAKLPIFCPGQIG
jgi:hypothetical protein